MTGAVFSNDLYFIGLETVKNSNICHLVTDTNKTKAFFKRKKILIQFQQPPTR